MLDSESSLILPARLTGHEETCNRGPHGTTQSCLRGAVDLPPNARDTRVVATRNSAASPSSSTALRYSAAYAESRAKLSTVASSCDRYGFAHTGFFGPNCMSPPLLRRAPAAAADDLARRDQRSRAPLDHAAARRRQARDHLFQCPSHCHCPCASFVVPGFTARAAARPADSRRAPDRAPRG